MAGRPVHDELSHDLQGRGICIPIPSPLRDLYWGNRDLLARRILLTFPGKSDGPGVFKTEDQTIFAMYCL